MNREAPSRWIQAWPDLLAFLLGLGLAWSLQWKTRDLVWSLWLSSLLVGYAMLVWGIFSGILFEAATRPSDSQPPNRARRGGSLIASLIGGVFLLGFFTVHFGGFHFVHSVFLNLFFPVLPGAPEGPPGFFGYVEVLHRYGWFVPLALIAERHAFRLPSASRTAEKDGSQQAMVRPYKNVVRLHLLIFFFAFAHFAKLDHFLVYAVVYAVYFFPWRLLRHRPTPA